MRGIQGHLLWCCIINIIDFLKSDLEMQSGKSSRPYCTFSPANSMVLYYKKISLGYMNMKRVPGQATDWHMIFTIGVSDKDLVSS